MSSRKLSTSIPIWPFNSSRRIDISPRNSLEADEWPHPEHRPIRRACRPRHDDQRNPATRLGAARREQQRVHEKALAVGRDVEGMVRRYGKCVSNNALTPLTSKSLPSLLTSAAMSLLSGDMKNSSLPSRRHRA